MKVLIVLWSWMRWLRDLPFLALILLGLAVMWYIPPVTFTATIFVVAFSLIGYCDYVKHCKKVLKAEEKYDAEPHKKRKEDDPSIETTQTEAIILLLLTGTSIGFAISYWMRWEALAVEYPTAVFLGFAGGLLMAFSFLSFALIALDTLYLNYKRKQEND